jgi:hypothetical protein
MKLDSFSPFSDPVLIKVDVEGAEESVLEGAFTTLKTYMVVLFIEVHFIEVHNPPLMIDEDLCNCEICRYLRHQIGYRALVLERSSRDHRVLAISPYIPYISSEKEASIDRLVLSYISWRRH